jgi:hypothetical protein
MRAKCNSAKSAAIFKKHEEAKVLYVCHQRIKRPLSLK